VIHGVDYNGNGTYAFDSAGAGELNPTCPPRPPTRPSAAFCADQRRKPPLAAPS
jgi:hypothetical protein